MKPKLPLSVLFGIACLALVLCSACGNKQAGDDDCVKCREDTDSTHDADLQAKKDALKYQNATTALNPAFPLLELPLQLFDGDAGIVPKDVSKDLLDKHLAYYLLGPENNLFTGLAALGRFEGPDGKMRYLISQYGKEKIEYILFAYDDKTEDWVPLVVMQSSAKGTEYHMNRSAGIYADGVVVLTDWKTKYRAPGEPPADNPDDDIIGNKTETRMTFKGGKWQKE